MRMMKFGKWTPRVSSRGRRALMACVLLLASFAMPAPAQPGLAGLMGSLKLSGNFPGGWTPPFQARTAKGARVALADFRGRVVLLNFWATWCRPCREEMPALQRLHRDFAPRGLTVLGLNVGEEEQAVGRFARRLGLTFPLVLDPKSKISRAYEVVGLPTTILLARDGRPVALAVGERKWGGGDARALIRLLLAEPIPAQR